MTLAQFRAVSKRVERGDRSRDYGFGIIAATIANVHRKKDQRPYQWTFFMPHWKGKEAQRTPEEKELRQANLRLYLDAQAHKKPPG